MPRPTPRPSDCVRRAWHSDRHQPIRGSLIQEIFRLVNDIHNLVTKKNKQWQEKLPVVVLKAEEIMYSKANSEDEYMDLKTLYERTNDAINTIIRRDETTETGGFLQPCIEAALNLGCMPRRASRSQRNINPRSYLCPTTQEPAIVSPCIVEITPQGNVTTDSSGPFHFITSVKPTTANITYIGLESRNPVSQNNYFTSNDYPRTCYNQGLPVETYPASNLCSVYPLYYGNFLKEKDSQFGFGTASSINKELATMSMVPNFFYYNLDASNKACWKDSGEIPEIECDLSLKLGLSQYHA